MTGDWNGDSKTTVGVACQNGSQWNWGLTNVNAASTPTYSFNYGSSRRTPVTGDWNGDGTVTVGVGGQEIFGGAVD